MDMHVNMKKVGKMVEMERDSMRKVISGSKQEKRVDAERKERKM